MSLRSEVIRIINEVLGRSKKISEMDAAGALSGAELIEVVKNGVNVRTTVSAVGTGGGATAFTQLSDVPGSYVGQAGLVATVNGAETGLEFTAASGGLTEADLTASRTLTSAGATLQTDNLNIVYADSASPFNITVDLLTAKTQVTVINKGAGTVTLIEGAGVTLVGTTIDIQEGEIATIIYEDAANPDVYLSTGTGGGSGDLTIGVSTITSGTNGNFLYNNAGVVGERTPGAGVATWFQTPSYANLGSALTGTSLWPLLASGGTLTGVNTHSSNTADQILHTGTFTTTANNQFRERVLGTYTLRGTASDEFYTRLSNETLVAGANSQRLISLKLNPTFTNGAFTTVANVALLCETGSVFIGSGIMNSVTKVSIRSLGTSSATIGLTVKDSTGQDYFTCYDDKTIQLFQGGTLRLGGTNDYVKSTVAGNLTFSSNGGTLAAAANRFVWGGSASSTTDQNVLSLETSGAVNPTSGSVNFYGIKTPITLNSTGTATGGWITYYSNPAVTTMPKVTGFKHEPTNPSNITGANIAYESVTGVDFIGSAGGTVTASTRVDQRGLGTTSSTINHRWANSSNTLIAHITDDGANYFLGKTSYDTTVTAGGTTGDRTINKPTGTVNIAAAGTTVTVTNSWCTTSSIVFAVVRTNDTTALIKNVVPGSGSFVINMNAAVTAETSIGFLVIN